MIVVISSCSARKDDSVPIPPGRRKITPSNYLSEEMSSKLLAIRERVLSDPRAKLGSKETYAFDLYVRAGNAYKDLFKSYNYIKVKEILLNNGEVEWFFISGGYGIIHALEEARSYQATFNKQLARRLNIPYTKEVWRGFIPLAYDEIFTKLRPSWVYVFGSKDYTDFIKETRYWREQGNVKVFESTGTAGPFWLSPIINSLANAILNRRLEEFNEKYPCRFIKQGAWRRAT